MSDVPATRNETRAIDLIRADPAAALHRAFLSGRNERTLAAYRQDLEHFRAFLNVPTVQEAVATLLERAGGESNALALAYKADMIERGLQPATVNRRLAALRSMLKLARTLGLVNWTLEVEGVKSLSYRDTRGPGMEGVRNMLTHLQTRLDAKGARDTAILRLLFDLGLRRGEVVSLDLSDLDLDAGTVSIMGKGRTQRETLSLPDQTIQVLKDWLALRGSDAGPMFPNFDRAGKGKRLTGRSLHRIVKRIGLSVGVDTRPHGLRHAAITEALDVTHGDVRAVQRFSRHRDVRTLTLYDDNRRDMGGEVAKLVASAA